MKKPKINDIDKQTIKKRYLAGEKVPDIAKDYTHTEISANTITNWIRANKWKVQKDKVNEVIEARFEKEISKSSAIAIDKLTNIIKRSTIEGNVIAACRAILDISGLKTSNINDSRKKAVDKDTLEAIEKQLGLDYKANKKA